MRVGLVEGLKGGISFVESWERGTSFFIRKGFVVPIFSQPFTHGIQSQFDSSKKAADHGEVLVMAG